MVVTADASPPIVSNEPDPSGPTFAIEPAPSAPSSDISSDTGTVSSTDTGSVMPDASLPDLTVGAPSDLPPILDYPAAFHRSREPPDLPTPQRPTSLVLRQIRLPVIPLGYPRPGSRVPPVVVPAPTRRAQPAAAAVAVDRSVLARHVRLVGVHDGRPAVAVRGAATTGCAASPAVAVRGPDRLPRL